jgi:phage-related tail protein
LKPVRKFVGVLLITAGVIGILLSLAGIAGVWTARPAVISSIRMVLGALSSSVESSRQAVTITEEALDSSIDGMRTLSDVVHSLEKSVKNTRPAVETVSGLLNKTLPASVESAANSLNTAREAAVSLENAVKQLDVLQASLNTIPLINSLIPDESPAYEPQKPLSASLGELSSSLDTVPDSFQDVSRDLDKAAGDLRIIEDGLGSISKNVDQLSANLEKYRENLAESKKSMDSLSSLLTKTGESLDPVVTSIAVLVTLLFFCLLMTQVVVIDEGRRFLDDDESRLTASRQQGD